MRRLLAATAAVSALMLAAPAWAQSYPDPQGYPGEPDDPDATGPFDEATGEPDYGQPGMDPEDAMDPGGYSGDDEEYGPPSDYAPDTGDDDFGPPSDYSPDTGGDDYGPRSDSSPDANDQGAPQYPPYENVPPAPPAPRAPAYPPERPTPPQSTTPALEAGIPDDLLAREDALERRIREGGRRGTVPSFHVDNLLVQLDSIRAQQDELSARDGGLNHTTRTFIESRLERLERNVTW